MYPIRYMPGVDHLYFAKVLEHPSDIVLCRVGRKTIHVHSIGDL